MAATGNTLPRANAAPISKSGDFTPEWYNFLRTLATQVSSEALQAEILELAARVAELESHEATSAVITGLYSIATYGSLANGVVQITLQGDTDFLGPTMFYGTGPDSLRTWQRLFDAFIAGTGIEITDSGYRVLGVVETSTDIPGTGTTGDAWRVLAIEEAGLWAWDGGTSSWLLDPDATGRVGISATNTGGVLPVVTGEVPPVLVYADDGSLIYAPVSY